MFLESFVWILLDMSSEATFLNQKGAFFSKVFGLKFYV